MGKITVKNKRTGIIQEITHVTGVKVTGDEIEIFGLFSLTISGYVLLSTEIDE